MGESRDNGSFPVIPETDEYDTLSFLVRNRGKKFDPSEITAYTTISKASASKTLTRLFEKGLVKRTQGTYYVELDRAEDLKHRLESVDAAKLLHDTVPDDDPYTADDWEDKLDPQ